MKNQPYVLLIEGDEKDESLICDAIATSEVGCEVRVARDGLEASQILFANGSAPDLILIELAIAKLDDYALLSRIRSDEDTKRLPVIVLAPPGRHPEVDTLYAHHVNSFVEKDLDPGCLEARMKIVLYYWIAVNHNAIA